MCNNCWARNAVNTNDLTNADKLESAADPAILVHVYCVICRLPNYLFAFTKKKKSPLLWQQLISKG